MGRKLAIGLVIVAVIGAGFYFSDAKVMLKVGHGDGHFVHRGGAETSGYGTIKVSGHGLVFAAPDTATLSVGVESFNINSDQALSENNRHMASVIEGLQSLGLTMDELQTSGFSLRRIADKDKRRPGDEDGFVGYRVNNSIRIETKKIELIEPILSNVIGWGATEVERLSFELEDDSEFRTVARERAVDDAIRHARELVEASGGSLGKVVRIDDEPSRYSRRTMPKPKRSDVLDPDAPLFLTTEMVYASVSVTLRMHP